MKFGRYLYAILCLFVLPVLVGLGISFIFGRDSALSRILGYAAGLFTFKICADHVNAKYPNN